MAASPIRAAKAARYEDSLPAAEVVFPMLKRHYKQVAEALTRGGLEEAVQVATNEETYGLDRKADTPFHMSKEDMNIENETVMSHVLTVEAPSELVCVARLLCNDEHTLYLPSASKPAVQTHALRALTSCMEHLWLTPKGLELRIGDSVIHGGWVKGYKSVNVDKFQESKQRSCVVSFKPPEVKMIRELTAGAPEPLHSLGKLNAYIMDSIHDICKETIAALEERDDYAALTLEYVDFLFKYDNHSHFTYHQDLRDPAKGPDSVLTVVMKLTVDKTTLHVAGAGAEAKLFDIGDAQVFLSGMFHRSGDATVRTVLVSFFYSESSVEKAGGTPGAGSSECHAHGDDQPSASPEAAETAEGAASASASFTQFDE